MRTKAILLIAILFLGQQLFAQLSTEDEKKIQEFLQSTNTPAVSIAIVDNYELTYVKAFGVKDIETGEKADPQTLFQAASISKPITGSFIMKAVEKGKMKLDEPIRTYLTSFELKKPKDIAEPTVRHLLSHTAGTNMSGFYGYKPTRKRMPDNLMVLRGKRTYIWERQIKVKKAPGTEQKYSGGGYCVLQQAVMDQEGKAFEDIMKEDMLHPIGMTSSFFGEAQTVEQKANLSSGHKKKGDLIKGKNFVYPQLAAAGLWTTPTDLATFMVDMLKASKGASSTYLTQKSFEQMIEAQELNHGEKIDRGLSFKLVPNGDQAVEVFRHSGSNYGYTCYMYGNRTNGKAVIIMFNRHQISGTPIRNMIWERIGFWEKNP
ncbi:MAG: serine hydrolase domain-containing protein [Bacteroidota bacterium]